MHFTTSIHFAHTKPKPTRTNQSNLRENVRLTALGFDQSCVPFAGVDTEESGGGDAGERPRAVGRLPESLLRGPASLDAGRPAVASKGIAAGLSVSAVPIRDSVATDGQGNARSAPMGAFHHLNPFAQAKPNSDENLSVDTCEKMVVLLPGCDQSCVPSAGVGTEEYGGGDAGERPRAVGRLPESLLRGLASSEAGRPAVASKGITAGLSVTAVPVRDSVATDGQGNARSAPMGAFHYMGAFRYHNPFCTC